VLGATKDHDVFYATSFVDLVRGRSADDVA